MSKMLIGLGVVLVVVGLIYHYFPSALSWFGNLPGDIKIEKEHSKFYFPIVSMVVVSIIFNVLIRLYKHFQ